jgi:hypothetical protein
MSQVVVNPYRYADSLVSPACYNDGATSVEGMDADSRTGMGIQFDSTAELIGKGITGASFWIKTDDSTTGTIYCRHYNSGGVLQTTYGSMGMNSLTTSYVFYEFYDGTATTLANGDRIIMEMVSHSGSAVRMYIYAGTPPTGQKLAMQENNSSWSTHPAQSTRGCFQF